MKKQTTQNTAVIAAALGAALLAIYSNTNWLSAKHKVQTRERCYGVARSGKNDCGTVQHSCAAQAATNNDPMEFIMMPAGLCERIVGGKIA